MRRWITILETISPASTLRKELISLGASMGLNVDIALHHDFLIELSMLITPPEMRRKGLATSFMKEMCRRADEMRVNIELYAEPIDNALLWSDLISFYNQFGFVNTPNGGVGYMERPHQHST